MFARLAVLFPTLLIAGAALVGAGKLTFYSSLLSTQTLTHYMRVYTSP